MTSGAGADAIKSTALNRKVPSSADIALGATAFLIPFISWGQTPWLTGPFVLLVAIALLAVLREAWKGGNVQFPATPVWIPLTAALVLSLAHLLFSPVPYSSLLFVTYLCIALVLYWLWWARGSFLKPATVALLWTGLLVPWVVLEALLRGYGSAGGPFINPNYTATVLLVCMATALGTAVSERESGRYVAVMILTAVLGTGGLMAIGSRSAGLGMIILWAAYLFLRKDRLRWLAIAAIAVILFMPNTIRYRVTEGYKTDPHAFSRLQIWKAALRMGMDHPFMGVGPGLFYEYGPVYAFPTEDLPVRYGRIARKPHNEYLRSWAEGGAVGVAALVLFLVMALRLGVLSFREGRAGPALSMGMLLYQALFHDLTEVLALMVLLSWCLAQLTPARSRTVAVQRGKGLALAASAAILILCLTVLINLDLASRSQWLKGKRLMERDLSRAARTLETATLLNPLLPGARRELALARLMVSRQTGSEEAWERAEGAILEARRLNRLDTVPLRLRADHYTDIARYRSAAAPEALALAADQLKRAGDLEPNNALILLSLSEVYWDLGQRERALDLIDEALAREPNYLQAHRVRIKWLATVKPDQVPRAESELAQAKERAAGYRPLSDYEGIILR